MKSIVNPYIANQPQQLVPYDEDWIDFSIQSNSLYYTD
jgi:hypothetical protein